jgi:hypothetical protein
MPRHQRHRRAVLRQAPNANPAIYANAAIGVIEATTDDGDESRVIRLRSLVVEGYSGFAQSAAQQRGSR